MPVKLHYSHKYIKRVGKKEMRDRRRGEKKKWTRKMVS